jgi:ubiquinone/menaquinone biosynthesis C-methylase UbiE
MADTNVERFLWMIDVLSVRPSDLLLEIGCGSGISAELIARTLTTGKITAIDKSQAMLAKALTRNKKFINDGKVEFIHKDLSSLPVGTGVCDKVFAFNVNLFWTKKDIAKEMRVIESHVKRNGRLYLFYQPPGKDRCKSLSETVAENIKSHGYRIMGVLHEEAVRSCCIISRLR